MKIYFVRHGESEENVKKIIYTYSEGALTKKGIKQAEETRESIPQDYDEIYSSDSNRCRQTAEILNNKLNLPITYDARLRERDFGSLQGKKWEDVENWEYLKKRDIMQQEYDYRPFGGESVEEVKERLLSFIEEIRQKNKKVLVVTSAGIIRLLHHLFKGKVPEKIHHASIHEFDFPDK